MEKQSIRHKVIIITILLLAFAVPITMVIFAMRNYREDKKKAELLIEKQKDARNVDANLRELQLVLEKIVDSTLSQSLQNHIEIPVSPSAFAMYRKYSERLANQLGPQIATLSTSPGKIHLILKLPATSKNSILESLSSGLPLDANAFPKNSSDDSMFSIVIQERP